MAQHLFTTRQLVLSRLGSGSAGAMEQRDTHEPRVELAGATDGWAAVAASLGGRLDRLMHVAQVHGATVRVLQQGCVGEVEAARRPEADALVADAPGLLLAVQAADCVPVLMADARRGAVAAVHAGWRGTLAGVAPAAIEAMRRAFGTNPADLVVAIGPSIGAYCYEVGGELLTAFLAAGVTHERGARWFSAHPSGRWRLDLWAANADQLREAGVPDDQVFVAGLCTKTHANLFDSFRADGVKAGRLAAVIAAPAPGAIAARLAPAAERKR
ncbi:MAG: peptidoglycan editing factor PgeF [Acidobacteriota bacterium]